MPEGLIHGVVELREQGHWRGVADGIGRDAKAGHEDHVQCEARHRILSLHICAGAHPLQPVAKRQALLHQQAELAPAHHPAHPRLHQC